MGLMLCMFLPMMVFDGSARVSCIMTEDSELRLWLKI